MARRVEPCRKTPEERLSDLFDGHAEAVSGGAAAALKYLERTLDSSASLPNAVKFFAHALLVEAAAGVGTDSGEDRALAALAEAEAYLPVAADEMPRALSAHRQSLRFLEVGVSLRTGRGEFDEALRLCDLALSVGYGREFEAKKGSLLRMV